MSKLQDLVVPEFDQELYKQLYDESRGISYNLGLEFGGPIYMGLFPWLKDILKQSENRLFLLAPSGYMMYQLLKDAGFQNVEYLDFPMDSLIRAGMEELSEREMEELLPRGEDKPSVEGFLNRFGLSWRDLDFFAQAGFEDAEEEIDSEEQLEGLRKLFADHKTLFLQQCRKEREKMKLFFQKSGFFTGDALVFSCDWDGKAQYYLERFGEAIDSSTKHQYYYFGTLNTDAARYYLQGKHFTTFAFRFYTNYVLQWQVRNAFGRYQAIFSAPLQKTETEKEALSCQDILQGIRDYLEVALPMAKERNLEYDPETVIGYLHGRLLDPKKEEQEREEHALLLHNRYRLEDLKSVTNFQRWIKTHEPHEAPRKDFQCSIKFSIVIPVYNTVTEQLSEAIESVLNQIYDNYELILVDDHSTWESVVPTLKKYEQDRHVHVIYRQENGHISTATNDGIAYATGDYIVFMDCDDVIVPDALYQFALKLRQNPELDFVYSDEDKITEDGKVRHMPHFKPDWSPELFWCMMYTNHLGVYRASIVKEIGGLRSAYNGSQDYDMTLRFLEKSDNKRVGHIPMILYHWRERKESAAYQMSAKSYAITAAVRAKEDAILRRGLSAHMEEIVGSYQYRIVYDVKDDPLVSIIIPSKDHYAILKQCVDSIREFTKYQNYEIIVVDNGSSFENREKIAAYLQEKGVTYLYEIASFNFSKMCNQGVASSKGEYLLFLNDDIELFEEEWLSRMLGQGMQKETGAVGAKLFFPKTTIIQHAGVYNSGTNPEHSFYAQNDDGAYGMGYHWVDRDCIAVTAACLLVSRRIYDEIGGFDESFPVAYNDVDFCFRIYKKGYYNVIRDDVVAYHHESLSRRSDMEDDAKLVRLRVEEQRLYQKHPDLRGVDPFINPNHRRYAPSLDLKNTFEKVIYTKVRGSGKGIMGNVDGIDVTDEIHIWGWCCLPERRDNEAFERFLILEDPYGQQYKSSVTFLFRGDLIGRFEDREDLFYTGFEAVLDMNVVRLDMVRYRLGMQIIDTEGKSHFIWFNQKTHAIRHEIPRFQYAICKGQPNGDARNGAKKIHFCLDEQKETKNGIYLRGWAFCNGHYHFRYKKNIVLKPKDGGESLLFEVQEEERPDVASFFPEYHYLYYTGFLCNIYRGALQRKKEYEVYIRMSNHFDSKDEWEVNTGKVIRNDYEINERGV